MTRKLKFRGQLSPIMSAIRMGGDVMRISIDVPMTERENAIGLLALTDQALVFEVAVDGSPATPEKPKKVKGPYGEYWRLLRIPHNDICNWPDFAEVLDCTRDQVWEALHAEFETETMSTVSPRQFEAWVTEKGLSEQLITISRNAEVKAAEKVATI